MAVNVSIVVCCVVALASNVLMLVACVEALEVNVAMSMVTTPRLAFIALILPLIIATLLLPIFAAILLT